MWSRPAGQPSTATARCGPSVSRTAISTGPGWTGSCSSATPSGVQTFGGSRRFHSRGSPHQSHQAREGIRGDWDSQGLAVECLRSELEKAKLASRRRPINVDVDECRKFIARSEKRIIDLDEERTQEMASLTQARERLQRLEAEQVSDSDDPAPRLANRKGCSEGQVGGEEERDKAVRHSAQAPGSGSPRSIHPSPLWSLENSTIGCRTVIRICRMP